MDKSAVTDILEEIAVLLELTGENPFKARAYTNAARALDNYEGDLDQLLAEDRLEELPGIGEALHQKITELVKTGRLEYYEKLKASVPEGMLEMLDKHKIRGTAVVNPAALRINPMIRDAPGVYRTLVVARNQRWIGIIANRLQGKGEAVMVVGVGHLIGPDGVPNLLRAQGIQVDGP